MLLATGFVEKKRNAAVSAFFQKTQIQTAEIELKTESSKKAALEKTLNEKLELVGNLKTRRSTLIL